MANNILDLEPQKIQKLGGGVQAPTVKVANEDISGSVNKLTNTIMEIGGSIIQNNKRKEIAERKDLKKQEEQNIVNYNKIFKIKSGESMNSAYAKMTSESENFYDDPTAFYNSMDSARDSSYKAISDNKGLTEVSKAELQADLGKKDRILREDFRTGVNKFNTERNKEQVDDIVNGLANDVPNYVYDGDIESAQSGLLQMGEALKLGKEINPDEYTDEKIAQYIGVVSSKYLESYVVSSIEKFKGEHDLSTTEGVNDFVEQLVAFDKNFDDKGIKTFFKDTFKELPFEQKDVGTKVHSMIKKQVEQQLWMAKNKKVGIEEKTLKEKKQLQLNPHKGIQDEGIVYNGKDSNKGLRAKIIGAQVDEEFATDLEAEKHVIDNNLTYSTYSKEGMAVFKKSIGEMLKVNDVDGMFRAIEKEYDFKVLDEDGLVASDLDEEMFGKDLIEATGGLIDSNYLKAYTNDNVEEQEAYKTSLRFGNKNNLIGGNIGESNLYELSARGFFGSPVDVGARAFGERRLPFAKEKGLPFIGVREIPFKEMDDKISFMNLSGIDVKEPERLRVLVNDWAFSNFYENIISDEDTFNKYNSEDKKGRGKMINDFYDKTENITKLNEASKTLSNNFLEGNIINVTSGQMPSKILVSEKYKDLDYNGIKENIIEHGSLIYVNPDSGEPFQISSLKLRANLIIETVDEDIIGFFYKDKQHPLKFSENGKLKNAETELNTFTTFEKTLGQDVDVKGLIEKGKETMEEISKELSSKIMKIRNVRNNNAGNLKEIGIKWKGKLKETDSGGNVASGSFTKFKTPQHGVRALNKDLTTKIDRGLNTITQILNVYAPDGKENDTQAYIQSVSESTGIDPNQVLNENDMFNLVKAIISHEGGRESMFYYTDKIIQEGMRMK